MESEKNQKQNKNDCDYQITIGEFSGFCFGVQNAVNIAMKQENAVTFGDIIHNDHVISMLEQKGIFAVEEVEKTVGKKVVIRSHGISQKLQDELSKTALEVVDATCPFVKKIHQIVYEKSNDGNTILICGVKGHAEVEGILGHCENGECHVCESTADVANLELEGENLTVVSQTTFSKAKFEEICESISLKGAKTVEVFNTICYTTEKRQVETRRLCENADLCVVVGGKKSSNTRKLFEIASELTKTIFVDKPSEIEAFDISGFKNIIIVAGASTPRELSKEVKFKMEEMKTDLVSAEISMDDVMESLEKKKNFRRGQIIECTIEQITDDGLHLSLPNAKTEVLLPAAEVSLEGEYDKEAFKVGESLSVKVLEATPKLLISLKAIEEEAKIDAEMEGILQGEEFTMAFSQSNKGGLKGRMGTYTIFVPGSQLKVGFVNPKDFPKYIGKKLRLKVIKAEGKDLIASQKAILEVEKQAKEDGFWNKIAESEIVTGKVMRFTDFGAFVSVEGFDCLAHISDLSWDNIKSCDEVLEIGKEFEFKVLKADRATSKVSLGFKQLQKRPIEIIAEKYPIGSIITGDVIRLRPFGAIVKIEENVEGLIHISQISHTYVDNIAHALAEGDSVDAKVIDIDMNKNKINLSIKALLPEPEKKVEDRPARAPRRRQEGEFSRREDELTSWVTSEPTGVSIADLLGKSE
ncbi:MAG: 4-hydroxy-3-methylbut-2-enyl diphosphate reductase [Bacillota bacterium]